MPPVGFGVSLGAPRCTPIGFGANLGTSSWFRGYLTPLGARRCSWGGRWGNWCWVLWWRKGTWLGRVNGRRANWLARRLFKRPSKDPLRHQVSLLSREPTAHRVVVLGLPYHLLAHNFYLSSYVLITSKTMFYKLPAAIFPIFFSEKKYFNYLLFA